MRAILKRCNEAGGGARLGERGTNAVADKIMDKAWLAEAHLCLGRMNIDVNFLRRHLQIEENYGIRSGRENVAVSLRECMEDELVADQPLIDKHVDGVAVELLQLGFGDEASETKKTRVGCNVVLFALPGRGLGQTDASEIKFGRGREHVVAGLSAEDLEEPICAVANSWGDKESLRGRVKLKVF